MTIREAKNVLIEMNKWRRGDAPYDWDGPENHRGMPYLPSQFGEAIDVGVEALEHWIGEHDEEHG